MTIQPPIYLVESIPGRYKKYCYSYREAMRCLLKYSYRRSRSTISVTRIDSLGNKRSIFSMCKYGKRYSCFKSM